MSELRNIMHCTAWSKYVQGVSYWNVSFKLTLTDRNMKVRFCLKVTVGNLSFQKINFDWPQQPLPEFSVWVFIILSKDIFLKHQNEIILVLRLLISRTRMALKSSLLIFQTLKTSAASLTSVASATSLASTASLYSPISSKNFLILMVWSSITPKWPIVVIFCGMGSSKIKIFTDIGGCWGLRPTYDNYLKTGWWNSNLQTSEICK